MARSKGTLPPPTNLPLNRLSLHIMCTLSFVSWRNMLDFKSSTSYISSHNEMKRTPPSLRSTYAQLHFRHSRAWRRKPPSNTHGPAPAAPVCLRDNNAPGARGIHHLKHLFILRQARLIESIKNGRWVYYRLPQRSHRLCARCSGVDNPRVGRLPADCSGCSGLAGYFAQHQHPRILQAEAYSRPSRSGRRHRRRCRATRWQPRIKSGDLNGIHQA